MSDSVFVLGAGFSRHAGMPLVQELRALAFDWLRANADDPRVSVHMKYLPNWPEFPNGKFWDSLHLADPISEMGFEELMVALRQRETEYPACVQAYHVLRYASEQLLWSKQRAVVNVPEAYRNFAQHLLTSRGVVSFNWDLVCERAIEEATSVTWGYSIEVARIPVIKPHGSLNWTSHVMQRDWGREIQNLLGFNSIAPGSTISYMPGEPFDDPLLQYDSRDLRCLIYPGIDDFLEHNPGLCAATEKKRLWAEATRLLERAHTVVFIGYSLPPYDAEAVQVLKRVCREKDLIVCNPSDEVIARFANVFKDSRIEVARRNFEDSAFAVATAAQEAV